MPRGINITKEVLARIHKLKAEGITTKIIAIRLGLSVPRVNQLILERRRDEKQDNQHV